MAMKLPRETIEELEGLVEQLSKHDAPVREAALARLEQHERSGRVPLEALLEFCEADNPSLSMYAITALGRNGQKGAVRKLCELAERHQGANPLLLETIVDALGEAGSRDASGTLLGLLGIRTGWTGKLFGRRSRKEEDDAAAARNRGPITLPVIRALERIEDPKAAELLGDFLGHEDPLVRWHTVQSLVRCGVATFNDRIREMAERDDNELVREAASLAIDRLEMLPPNLNN